VSVRILVGDAREILATLPAESVHMVCTSPPYWGLRDYGLPPTVWGGEDPGCAHAWGDEVIKTAMIGATLGGPSSTLTNWSGSHEPAKVYAEKVQARSVSQGAFCARCNAWRGALGLEPDPALYVAHLVEVFRAVRRVLRQDGTCWVNLGDSYCAAQGLNADGSARMAASPTIVTPSLAPLRYGEMARGRSERLSGGGIRPVRGNAWGLKPKDLVGMPWRVAFALQADGWWLRSEIIWAKPNPMPESVTDRPTKAHEQLFLLAKAERYFFDAEAIREPQSDLTLERFATGDRRTMGSKALLRDPRECLATYDTSTAILPNGRNRRSVWTIPSAPFAEAHFATFPPALVEPCVKAGTSARGACPACGAPWRRIVETTYLPGGAGGAMSRIGTASVDPASRTGSWFDERKTRQDQTLGWAPTCGCGPGLAPGVVEPCVQAGTSERGCCAQCGAPWRRAVERSFLSQPDVSLAKGIRGAGDQKPMYGNWQGVPRGSTQATTLGWAPPCACGPGPDPVPCVVLDPFAGAGTVGLVSERLGRDAILIELKPEYAAMAERRIREEAPLLTAVEVEAAAPPANGNGHAAIAPEQLALLNL
jgi:DNA modification methylase